MRILAVGDIHGCTRAFDTLLEAVNLQPEDCLVTLGDYIDRGKDSQGAIARLISLHKGGQLIALKGNHEIMMLEARNKRDRVNYWLQHGGKETLASYGNAKGDRTLANIPEEHWDFIENVCRSYWEIETHFFVHANAYPDLALEEQPDYMLFWEKFNNPPPHYSGKTMVCGHTSQKSGKPIYLKHAICLDTWVYGKGWLTCLDVASGRVWQANEKGKLRTAWIDEF